MLDIAALMGEAFASHLRGCTTNLTNCRIVQPCLAVDESLE